MFGKLALLLASASAITINKDTMLTQMKTQTHGRAVAERPKASSLVQTSHAADYGDADNYA